MRLAVISDCTYRASSPDYENCLSTYGSEWAHAVLAKAFADRGHDVHFFAPAGSEPIGKFHPTLLDYGAVSFRDSVDKVSINPYTLDDLVADVDYVIDMSAQAMTIENLRFYHGFRNYLVYRNGFESYQYPRLPSPHTHFVVPSKQNARIFSDAGYPAQVANYGIPDFYAPGFDNEYFWPIDKKYGLKTKYFLFPHRPTPDKGVDVLLMLAAKFPDYDFVIAGAPPPIYEHQMHLDRVRYEAQQNGLKNLKIVELPLNPRHHYYKRELMRRATAVISPVGQGYLEGFGLANAEAVACGIPLIISDTPSARELWLEGVDAEFVDSPMSFANAVHDFKPEKYAPKNRYTVEKYYQRYLELLSKPELMV